MRIFNKHKPKPNREKRPRTLLEKMDETKFNPYERKNGEAMTEIEKMDQGFNGKTYTINGIEGDFS